MRVKLEIPETMRMFPPKHYGEHIAYHGQTGIVISGAQNEGAWVQFDTMPNGKYVGCPLSMLSIAE